MNEKFLCVSPGLYQYADLSKHIYGPIITEQALKNMSATQLFDYIEAITKRKPIELDDKLPEPLTGVHFTEVIRMAKQHIENIAKQQAHEDTPHYIYEGVMEAVYGKKIWDWVNKRI